MDRWFPIRTRRLLLREFFSSDEKGIHEYAGDPIVTRYVDWGPNTADQTRERLRLRLEEQRKWPRDDVTLAVELREEGNLIGAIRLSILDRQSRVADIGFVFNRRYWNRGYATEASRAVLRVAFSLIRLHRVWATCDPRNLGSWRVMEKAGMRREGLLRRFKKANGATHTYMECSRMMPAHRKPTDGA